MKNPEKAQRPLEVLVQEFKKSVGNFADFNQNMTPKERVEFKGWLAEMRTNRICY
jgi:hypothetical protein